MSLDIAGLKPITVPFSNLTLSGGGFTNARKTRSMAITRQVSP